MTGCKVAASTECRQRGAVALEFLMLFPLVVAMLYAAAIYSVLFFSKYRMQDAVDQAVSSAMRIDRSAYDSTELGNAVVTLSSGTLATMIAGLPDALVAGVDTNTTNCVMVASSGVDLLRCSITVNSADNPIVPTMSFGFLGEFPPLPDTLSAQSVIAI
ncbi:TadE/TadG family type IV pilus assembly protein [Marinobacter mobilis]|uniref:TadE-like protein n=1 Tax=Marinobacter mobilis TaxID=488533 RepID=A0A1H2Y2V2_9GAMM|nr:TadE/TadG family type IV pilus assembly protein [Marinobacter mobilis]SDW99502.1 TadE-like protein [Marinobacter mobilis]